MSEPPSGSVVAMPRKASPAVTLGKIAALISGVPYRSKIKPQAASTR
jgi:hypothetical protein